jgi:hypothetical protein
MSSTSKNKNKEKVDESSFDKLESSFEPVFNATKKGVLSLHEEARATAVAESGKSLEQLAGTFIDTKTNDNDMYGDGDQSYVRADFPTDPGQRLRDMWSESGDFYTVVQSTGSPFMKACFLGKAQAVKDMIEGTQEDAVARIHLLELRESTLRFSPLMACICGAKNKNYQGFAILLKNAQHFLVAEYLCAASECR